MTKQHPLKTQVIPCLMSWYQCYCHRDKISVESSFGCCSVLWCKREKQEFKLRWLAGSQARTHHRDWQSWQADGRTDRQVYGQTDRQPARQAGKSQATTDLWSSLWSRESRFPPGWRRGRCTVLLTACSLLAKIRLLPGKYMTVKQRCGGIKIVHIYSAHMTHARMDAYSLTPTWVLSILAIYTAMC